MGAMSYSTPVTGSTGPGLVRFLRRGWKWILLGVVLGTLAALIVTKLQKPQYTAVTRVLVTATGIESLGQPSNSRTPNTTINLDTEAQLVTSASVIKGATEFDPALKRRSYTTIAGEIAVSVPPNTTVLMISVTETTPRAAQAAANAVAEAYLADRKATAQASLDAQRANATRRQDTFTTNLQDLIQQNAQTTAPSKKALIAVKIGLAKSQITTVNNQMEALNNVQITPGRVVVRAVRPTAPSSPSRVLNLVSGFSLGLLLGLLAAFLRGRNRRTVRTADDLSAVVDVPCLAVLPPSSEDPRGARSASTFRRIALTAASVTQHRARLVVTSPLLSDSASRVAAGLTVSLAHGGTTAALLQVHGPEFDVPHPRSISATRVNHADDLVIDTGDSLVEAVDRIRGRHAVLVVAVPGAGVDIDAQTMAAHADAVLLVVDAGTPSRTVKDAMAELDSVGAPLLGTVLVLGRNETLVPAAAEDPLRPPWAGGAPDGPADDGSEESVGRLARQIARTGGRTRSR